MCGVYKCRCVLQEQELLRITTTIILRTTTFALSDENPRASRPYDRMEHGDAAMGYTQHRMVHALQRCNRSLIWKTTLARRDMRGRIQSSKRASCSASVMS